MRGRIVVSPSLPEAISAALLGEGFEVIDSGAADAAVVALAELPPHGIRVVVVAAADEIVTAFAAGADDVVTPSVDPKELAARLDALLRRRGFTG
jgi:CheY-like chemotaxis protein